MPFVLGLPGPMWMAISIAFGYVISEIYRAGSTTMSEDAFFSYIAIRHKLIELLTLPKMIATVVYVIIGCFLAPKWWLTLGMALLAIVVAGPIIKWIVGSLLALSKNQDFLLFNVAYPILFLLSLATIILAYIAWF